MSVNRTYTLQPFEFTTMTHGVESVIGCRYTVGHGADPHSENSRRDQFDAA